MDSNWVDMKALTKVEMMEQQMERWKASLRAALKDCLKVERTGDLTVDKMDSHLVPTMDSMSSMHSEALMGAEWASSMEYRLVLRLVITLDLAYLRKLEPSRDKQY